MNKKTRKFRAAKHSESGVNSEKDVKVFVGHDIGIWSNSGKKSVDSSVSGHCGEAMELVRQGEDINYQGASGNVDIDENGDVVGSYDVWQVGEDGSLSVIDKVNPVADEQASAQ